MVNKFIPIVAVLLIGLIVGFSAGWLVQQQNINSLNTTLSNQDLVVQNGEIHLKATINGKFFTNTTFHAVAYAQGKNGEMAIFKTAVTPKQFYDALISLGATPGNNVQLTSDNTTVVQGSSVNVYVTWEGASKRYTLAEVINGANVDIKFGGNLENSNNLATGCITCLGSCPVGITSNAAYAYTMPAKFTANSSILPAAGSEVTIIYVPQA
jgi:hypothetical protein